MDFVFGPVASRRLGYSLGVEVAPEKTCSFNCIYCQVGATRSLTDKRDRYVPTEKVLSELEQSLPQDDLHYVTFSGSGEPTLNKDMGIVIDKIKSLCETPVCVITNSSLIHRNDVRKDLRKADLVIPSLDAATQEVLEKINRPIKGVTVEKIILGLKKFRKSFKGKMRLEIMLVKGVNDGIDHLAKLKEVVKEINPHRIDLNTVIRPPALDMAKALGQKEMDRIQGLFGEKAKVINSFDKVAGFDPGAGLDEEIYQLVRRRGITLKDLTTSFGLHKDVAVDVLNRLLAKGKIKKMTHTGQTYYRENY